MADSNRMELVVQALEKLQVTTEQEFAEVGMNTLEILTLLLVIFAALTYLDNRNNRK